MLAASIPPKLLFKMAPGQRLEREIYGPLSRCEDGRVVRMGEYEAGRSSISREPSGAKSFSTAFHVESSSSPCLNLRDVLAAGNRVVVIDPPELRERLGAGLGFGFSLDRGRNLRSSFSLSAVVRAATTVRNRGRPSHCDDLRFDDCPTSGNRRGASFENFPVFTWVGERTGKNALPGKERILTAITGCSQDAL